MENRFSPDIPKATDLQAAFRAIRIAFKRCDRTVSHGMPPPGAAHVP